ncbi:MAG TPA: hypothetical protein PLF16_01040 [Candidatus Staskawiczbacteria bacterium]|nr:hypothetical protein [Candidatus Staskawiczbacteria bacterium]
MSRLFGVFIIGSSKDERKQLMDDYYKKKRMWNLGIGYEVKIHLITGLGDLDNRLQECIPRMVFVRHDLSEDELAQIKGRISAKHPQLSVSFVGVKVALPAALEQPAV